MANDFIKKAAMRGHTEAQFRFAMDWLRYEDFSNAFDWLRAYEFAPPLHLFNSNQIVKVRATVRLRVGVVGRVRG